ncbi:MAG: hypothetical protein WBO73_03925 [Gammaproteobacteria bacterium]
MVLNILGENNETVRLDTPIENRDAAIALAQQARLAALVLFTRTH